MTDTTLQRIVGAVLIMLFIYQAGTMAAAVASTAAGALAGVFAAGVTFLCARQANVGTGNKAWFLVPTVLFTLLPLAYKAWGLVSSDSSLLAWAVSFLPLLVGFLLPVLLLWLVYAELHRRTIGG